jgi:L-asparaginase
MIKILVTGGTIDLSYDNVHGGVKFDKTHIDEILKNGNCKADYQIKTLMFKYSDFLSDKDRNLILMECKTCKERKIIITHGTNELVKTAKFLAKSIKNKTIILIGSMTPYTFVNSDAEFNVGFAMSSVQLLKNGIYIAMNGKVFNWDNVKKDKKKGEFKKI